MTMLLVKLNRGTKAKVILTKRMHLAIYRVITFVIWLYVLSASKLFLYGKIYSLIMRDRGRVIEKDTEIGFNGNMKTAIFDISNTFLNSGF